MRPQIWWTSPVQTEKAPDSISVLFVLAVQEREQSVVQANWVEFVFSWLRLSSGLMDRIILTTRKNHFSR